MPAARTAGSPALDTFGERSYSQPDRKQARGPDAELVLPDPDPAARVPLAWYGHLRFKSAPLVVVILASWGIALIEYCLAVPANRWGHAVYSAAELKTIQEVVTLAVFAGFSVVYLKEPLGWNHLAGFGLIVAGAFLVFQGRARALPHDRYNHTPNWHPASWAIGRVLADAVAARHLTWTSCNERKSSCREHSLPPCSS